MSIASTLRKTSNLNHSDFGAKLSELRALLADLAKSAPSAANETFDDLKNRAAALCDTCEDSVNGATHVVVKTVKEHPAQVAIAAVGAGLLAWWLLTRVSKEAE